MERLMFEEQLLANIPDSFQDMEPDKIGLMYPYEERPQIILEDKETDRVCTFSLLERQELPEGQIECAVYEMMEVVRSLYPSSILEKPQFTESRCCGWFSYKMANVEGELYQRMYILRVSGCMMLGTMGCRVDDEAGKEQMTEILMSLKDLKKRTFFRKLNWGGKMQ